ncbi:hypothetical protein BJ138DRAFT_1071218 [Hygrophoropsis aurantiaca]|uniref:Uncharacterized protein n=1 Tax=Hygrophoropsis aurantiaca TaxID=72124 RepID=A0ACB8A0G3_9AGAM|nr:hypothetical protein BJ138DRAFT_1071218 [Hygrophoropsis aurantiaca]
MAPFLSNRTAEGKKAAKVAERQRHDAWIAEMHREREALGGSPEGFKPDKLAGNEAWWSNHYQWLKDCGYLLRIRYSPQWVPSWKNSKRDWIDCEDSQIPWVTHILDATRLSDNTFVTLKIISKSVHPYEVDIGQYFSSESVASDPANHCVPIYEVLEIPNEPDRVILVMPLLRLYDDPRFDTIGEVMECLRQLFEGLQYMHRHHVAHRDCMNLNTMMDANSLYIDAFHPCQPDRKRDFTGDARHYTRTQRPPKYYFIDFGISRRYERSNTKPLEYPIWGGDKTVPEFQKSNEPMDPFPTDVYYLGNLIRVDFIQRKAGFEFMQGLVADMVQDDPTKRPTMDEVVPRFESIYKGLSSWKLRSRVFKKNESSLSGFFRGISHWTRRTQYVIGRRPSMPARS